MGKTRFQRRVNLLILIVFVFSGTSLVSCSSTDSGRERILLAKDTVSHLMFTEYTFEVFSDSSFVYSTFSGFSGDTAISTHKGKLLIRMDSLLFNSEISFNGITLAVLRNGYVEFDKGKYPYRIKIQNTSLPVSNFVNYEKYSDYAIFNDERIPKNQYFEITNEEMKMIDSVGRAYFKVNKKLVQPFENYLKQVVVSSEANGDIAFGVKCFCKTFELESEFRQALIDMSDGGSCNVSFLIDFKSKTCDYLIVAGEA